MAYEQSGAPAGPEAKREGESTKVPSRFDYDAFISYRRIDGADVALWLRSAMQSYRLPTELGRGRAPLRCFLDSAYVRASEDFWDLNIAPALARSRCLILVATKACLLPGKNGAENWVQRELAAFRASGGRPIYIVRGDGKLMDDVPEGAPELAERVDLRSARSRFARWHDQQKLSDGVLSLVAPLYEIPLAKMPLLRQEEARRAAASRRNRAVLALGVSAGFAGLLLYARHAVANAERERLRAAGANAVELAGQPGRGNEAVDQAVRTYAQAMQVPEVAESVSLGLAAALQVPVSRPLTGHSAQVTVATTSPDGTYGLTGDISGVAILWNLAIGTASSRFVEDRGPIVATHFTSIGGTTRAITVDAQGHVSGWALAGQRVGAAEASCQVAGSEGNDAAHRLFVRCADGSLREWTLDERPMFGESPRYPVDGVEAARYSADGRVLIVGTKDGNTSTWATDGHHRVAEWPTPGVSAVAITRDGSTAVAGTGDGGLYFLGGKSSAVFAVPSAHDGAVRRLEYSPDEAFLFSADDLVVKEWDTRSRKVGWADARHGSTILSMKIAPDGKLVVTSGRDNVFVRDAYADRLVATLSGHAGLCYDAAFTPDGRHVLTVNGDHTARFWTLPAPLGVVDFVGHSDEINSAQFSHDGRRVITGSDDGTAKIWDAASGTMSLTLRHNDQAANGAVFSLDDSRAVTAGQDGSATVYDAADGREVASVQHGAAVNWAALDREGKTVVTAGEDGKTRVWDVDTRKAVELESNRNHPMQFVGYSPAGDRLVTAGDDQRARVWDAESHELIATLQGHEGSVMSALFSKDGGYVVTASLDGTARVWDAWNGRALHVLRVGADGVRVMSAALSPDAREVATASADGRVELWDVTTGAALLVLQAGGKLVQRVEFSPSGDSVVISSNDKGARLYPSTSAGFLSLGCARAQGLPTWPSLREVCEAPRAGTGGLFSYR